MSTSIKLTIAVVVSIIIFFSIVFFTNTTEETTHLTENFTDETYINYPEIRNVVNYLEIEENTVKKLVDSKDELVFCFSNTSSDEMIYEYVRELEADGFEGELWDGTISSTFVVSQKDHVIEITVISDVDAWKENQVEEYVEQITDEDVLCKILVME